MKNEELEIDLKQKLRQVMPRSLRLFELLSSSIYSKNIFRVTVP